MRHLAPQTLRHRWVVAAALLAAVAVAAVAVALGPGSAPPITASGTTAVIPGDALAYVAVSLDGGSPPVKQALAVADRFPGFGLAGGVALGRFGEALAGGRAVDYASQVAPWIGHRGALALLNTTTSTAGTLVVVEVANRPRARQFVRAQGATAAGSYRGTPLLRYPNGAVLALIGSDLVIGQDASLRTALDVASGASPSLGAGATYRRAAATAPAGGVLQAYASAAGVRRVLAAQGGVLGALGGLLSAPGLRGVFMSVVPTAGGAHVQIHSIVSSGTGAGASRAFSPTLQNAIPAGAALMLDVTGLDGALPEVLSVGSAAGLSGDIGPLLKQLGTALAGGGVNVRALVSLFSGQAAVAILGTGPTATLVVASVAPQARAELVFGQIQRAMARLVPTSGGRSAARSVFRIEQVDGVTVHAFQLTPTLALDYAIVRGLVVVATNPRGIAAVAQRAHPLASDPSFTAALAGRPRRVTSLGYADVSRLLGAEAAAVSASPTLRRLLPGLQRIGAVGLTSSRGPGDATTDLSIQVR